MVSDCKSTGTVTVMKTVAYWETTQIALWASEKIWKLERDIVRWFECELKYFSIHYISTMMCCVYKLMHKHNITISRIRDVPVTDVESTCKSIRLVDEKEGIFETTLLSLLSSMMEGQLWFGSIWLHLVLETCTCASSAWIWWSRLICCNKY